MYEARERNTTLESPLQHETVLRNWKKETVNHEPYFEYHEPELECQNWKKKAVNYAPYQEQHEQEREFNKTFESLRDETALNNHTEVQDRINGIKQSILEVLAEHNTQNKNEVTGIKELLETVTKAQGNLAGRLDQIESESAKKNLSREFRDQASGSEVSWGEEPDFLDKVLIGGSTGSRTRSIQSVYRYTVPVCCTLSSTDGGRFRQSRAWVSFATLCGNTLFVEVGFEPSTTGLGSEIEILKW